MRKLTMEEIQQDVLPESLHFLECPLGFQCNLPIKLKLLDSVESGIGYRGHLRAEDAHLRVQTEADPFERAAIGRDRRNLLGLIAKDGLHRTHSFGRFYGPDALRRHPLIVFLGSDYADAAPVTPIEGLDGIGLELIHESRIGVLESAGRRIIALTEVTRERLS